MFYFVALLQICPNKKLRHPPQINYHPYAVPTIGFNSQVSRKNKQEWYFKDASIRSRDLTSQAPTYPVHVSNTNNVKL